MRLAKKHQNDLADRIESDLDYIPRLDRIPSHVKREAAEAAAKVAIHIIEAAR